MSITIIAAVAHGGCIGKRGDLPWKIPEDMKRFRALTLRNVVVMGRKTWESIPEKFRPLPDRTNVVLTRQTDYAVPEGVRLFVSLEDALRAFEGCDVFVLGGGEIYAQAIRLADRLEITEVDRDVDGCDTFFPQIDASVWKESARETREGFSFVTYLRAERT